MPFPDRLQGGVTPPRRKRPAVCRICVAAVGGAASPTSRKILRMGNTPKNHLAAGTGTAPAFCVKFGKEGGG